MTGYGLSMFPYMYVGSKSVSSLLSTTYNVGRTYQNWQYWNDYYANTHRRSKYPFRSGAYDYLNFASKVF